ncbi:nucleoside deaminase [Acetobacter musti]|uniref:tRNA-specific adenosine deaminase n=2 Tax=Acetobacter musti TaxID=864732 RepID=A0ABX0JHW7_9PROT|nr:nucleoside deaminase [Acetobacter musti]NHN83341.1 nucleoside deaminase [Acetobacter musti]
MDLALSEAREAARNGEVPVGAVILDADNRPIARASNRVEADHDASAHAELLAMRAAARARGTTRLEDCTLVVTLEPCPMCAAAAVHFRIRRIIFGAWDPKGGGVDHGPRLFGQPACLHRPETIGGIRERENSLMLKEFFRALRHHS